MDQNIINAIIRNYTVEHKSGMQIARLYDIPISTVYFYLHQNNIKCRNNHNNNMIHFNEHYFDNIDNEHKAYWLGFIFADGYVLAPKKYHQGMLGINILASDKNLLECFKQDINFQGEIKYYSWKTAYSNKKVNTCRICLTSNILYNALYTKGVVPRKSLITQFPDSNIIPEYLIKHFIRGYLDGDGSITNGSPQKNGQLDYKINFCGTFEFLSSIQSFFDTSLKLYRKPQSKDKNSFELSIGGNKQVKQIINILYKDATVYLDRKYQKAKNILEEI